MAAGAVAGSAAFFLPFQFITSVILNIMTLVDTILENFKSIPGWTATAENVALLRDILSEREKELANLQSECERFRAENADLKKQIAALSTGNDFEEYRGILWRRLNADTVEPAPYCKKCKHVMSPFQPAEMWYCDQCGSGAPYVQHPQATED